MAKSKQEPRPKGRKPLFRKRFGNVTITVQRSSRPLYDAKAIMRQGGKVLRENYFKTKAEALALAQQWEIEATNAGAQAAATVTDDEKRLFLKARNLLEPFGKTLEDALNFYVAHLNSNESSVPIHQAIESLLHRKEQNQLSRRYLGDLRVRLTRFEKHFPGRSIASITSDEVERFLAKLNVGPVTFNNEIRVLNVLWEFALSKKWVRENILARVENIKVTKDRPGVLTVPQTQALLNAASPEILPYFALGCFAGLRDEELNRLDWSAISFATGSIDISEKVSKTATHRLVPIQPNLRAWLQPLARVSGPIVSKNSRSLKLRARRDAGIEVWPHNACRHGYGTYRMAVTKHIGLVSEEMGNSPAICQKHYKKSVPAELGPEYFAIMPPAAGGNIVDFKLPAA